MNKRPLSVCIIAHNEAERIRNCLQSVADFASEIILVYNDCTDGTEAIARDEFGAQIFEESWHGHRDQKNIALKKATQPWVLCIDSDELLDETLRTSILAFLDADDPAYDGAYFPRKVWFLGRWIKHGDWYPDYSLRLIRNGKGKWAGSVEHDKMHVEGEVKKLPGDLLHYSFRDMNHQASKIAYFGDIFVERKAAKTRRWRTLPVIFRSFWRFFRAYFIRRGFLDGFPGFYIAYFQAFATFYRYAKIYEAKFAQPQEEEADKAS
ncbi:MAG: glycosyltransferase family 2 protein [Verrucomicrobiota bacterium]